ncbi:MAG TPA: oligogalacturonate lyase family protein [Tepidisphaeraceae bacterium]|jgi:hypothetical protein|nr:oligogalacturonate lyase family protein [Tepidisphaeraceae bacterium]
MQNEMADIVTPERVTSGGAWNDQLLYFTSPSLTADDSQLVFLSDRTGHPNVFVRDLRNGDERQVTTNSEGMLKSYVYFDGSPYRGLGKASVSLDAQRGIVYWIQGRSILAASIGGAGSAGNVRQVAVLPDDQMTAFTHVSGDGRLLCVPTVDARALGDDLIAAGKLEKTIDQRVQQEGLNSYLRIYDTDSGEQIACERVPSAWVTHVQFHPTDSSRILYNHEWPADCGVRRMWLWDGARHTRLRDANDGRGREDWVCHETWERGGDGVIYHGGVAGGPAFVGRVGPDGKGHAEVRLPDGWRQYGHFTTGADGVLVTDGYYRPEGESPVGWGGQWLAILRVDWAGGRIDWQPLCRHKSSWKSQDEHPHPVFDHAGRSVYFTSDREGKRAVYRLNEVQA